MTYKIRTEAFNKKVSHNIYIKSNNRGTKSNKLIQIVKIEIFSHSFLHKFE